MKKILVVAFMALAVAMVVTPAEAGVGGCGPRSGVGGCKPGGWQATAYTVPSSDSPSFLDRLEGALPLQVRLVLRSMLSPTMTPASEPTIASQPGTATIEGVGGCGPRRGVGGCKL